MKSCPTCQSTYTDNLLTYCLQDGTKLTEDEDDLRQMDTLALKEPPYPFPNRATKKKSFLWGKILFAILFLLGGICVHYLWTNLISQTHNSPDTSRQKPKPMNTGLGSFEEQRRKVDLDPVAYISAKGATPQDGEDYYLLGRVYLLTGDYVKARSAYLEATNRSGEIDEINRKSVTNEIAMAMAILNNTFTQRALVDNLSRNKLTNSSNTNIK